MAAKTSAEMLAEFSKKPLAVKLGTLAGVLAVLGFLYWQFYYSTLADEKGQQATQRKVANEEERRLKAREREWLKLVQKKELLDDQLKKNQLSLPASSELPAFFAHLQKQAAAAGVTIRRWQRKNESSIESYVKVPVYIEVSGSFYQINNYFRLLSQTDRIITIENLWLGGGSARNEELLLLAKFTAATFRQKDRPPDTTIGEPKPEAPKKEDKPAGAAAPDKGPPGQPPGAAPAGKAEPAGTAGATTPPSATPPGAPPTAPPGAAATPPASPTPGGGL
jgi:Tfp pilus assembly protein PilO